MTTLKSWTIISCEGGDILIARKNKTRDSRGIVEKNRRLKSQAPTKESRNSFLNFEREFLGSERERDNI